MESVETALEDTFFNDWDAAFDISTCLNEQSKWREFYNREVDALKFAGGWFRHTDLTWCPDCESQRSLNTKRHVDQIIRSSLENKVIGIPVIME